MTKNVTNKLPLSPRLNFDYSLRPVYMADAKAAVKTGQFSDVCVSLEYGEVRLRLYGTFKGVRWYYESRPWQQSIDDLKNGISNDFQRRMASLGFKERQKISVIHYHEGCREGKVIASLKFEPATAASQKIRYPKGFQKRRTFAGGVEAWITPRKTESGVPEIRMSGPPGAAQNTYRNDLEFLRWFAEINRAQADTTGLDSITDWGRDLVTALTQVEELEAEGAEDVFAPFRELKEEAAACQEISL